mmetsp:Transcript_20118/g.43367  ORF Transcript_20118/g.43367 Transcript_20118/m.43367 type:complete len:351 (-) Transcript_20118:1451-2503(-)
MLDFLILVSLIFFCHFGIFLIDGRCSHVGWRCVVLLLRGCTCWWRTRRWGTWRLLLLVIRSMLRRWSVRWCPGVWRVGLLRLLLRVMLLLWLLWIPVRRWGGMAVLLLWRITIGCWGGRLLILLSPSFCFSSTTGFLFPQPRLVLHSSLLLSSRFCLLFLPCTLSPRILFLLLLILLLLLTNLLLPLTFLHLSHPTMMFRFFTRDTFALQPNPFLLFALFPLGILLRMNPLGNATTDFLLILGLLCSSFLFRQTGSFVVFSTLLFGCGSFAFSLLFLHTTFVFHTFSFHLLSVLFVLLFLWLWWRRLILSRLDSGNHRFQIFTFHTRRLDSFAVRNGAKLFNGPVLFLGR